MEIKPIKPIQRVRSAETPDTTINRQQPRVPIQLEPPPGKWLYQSGQLILNGQNIADLLSNPQKKTVTFFSQLAQHLMAYYQYRLRRDGRRKSTKRGSKVFFEFEPTDELEHLAALIEAYIAKIMRLLKRRYDDTADGVQLSLDQDGQVLLNGMNVTAFILMAREYPTAKAKIFLQGIKNRLGLLLKGKHNAPYYDRLRGAVEDLFQEIDDEIVRITDAERLLEGG